MGLLDWLKRMVGGSPTGEKLPPPDQGRDLVELAGRLGLPTGQLDRVEPRYREQAILKRRGGQRRILIPTPELKDLQRRLLRRVLGRLPVHPAAMGFRRGHSIATHALLHAMRPVVVKMDLRDFFPSTRAERVHAYFRIIGWNDAAARQLVRWCTYDGGLPQGAPTSPLLSNAVNYLLDARLTGLAAALSRAPAVARNPRTLREQPGPGHADVWYSRYADDLTFSFGVDDRQIVQAAIYETKRIVDDLGYRLHTGKKLRIMRQHDRQTVTGLVVNAGVRLPRKTRRWLRAVEHHRATGRPTTLSDAELQGWRALQRIIDDQTRLAPEG